MKLYFMVTLIMVAIHMASAAWYQHECPVTKRVVWCPHEDPSHCLVYCSGVSNKEDGSTESGYYCYNTNPIIWCASTDRDYCTRFCRGAARATSLPLT